MFFGMLAMNDPCPKCGLIFQREEGYFLGAMYVSSAFSFILFGGGYFLASWLLPHWNEYAIVMLLLGAYLFLVPAIYRYSRIIWIYFDRWQAPTDTSAGSFEKIRAEEFSNDR